MLQYIFLAVCALLGARFITHVRYMLRKRQKGCTDPPSYVHRDPVLGADLFLRKMRALQSGTYLEAGSRLYESFSSKTFMSRSFGSTTYHTVDPEVVKGYQSTFFKDFGYEPLRFALAKNLWGNGIAVADGQHWTTARSIIRNSFDVVHTANMQRLEYHVGRFMELIPRDGSTVDLQPLFKRLVSKTLEFWALYIRC